MLESRVLFGASVLVCVTVQLAWSHREHKVHNIVLYPDKHSWCKTTPIKQVVAYPGCGAVHVDNNVCVGACFSYSIPRTAPSAPGEMIKPYCDSCQPSSVTWQHVTLTCEGEDDMEERVQMINNCSCSTCDMGEEGGGGGGHSPHHAATSPASPPPLVDVPELRDLMLHEEDEEEPLDLDSVALKELLRQVEGVDHRVNQAALVELVRKVEESENILLDIVKLRHVLTRYAREKAEKEQTGHGSPHVKVHRHHLHSHHHASHHGGAGGPDATHPILADMSGGSVETATTPQAGDGGGGSGGSGGFVGSGGIGNEGKGDPTLDVASHHLKPALHGVELGYHENVVLPESEKRTNKEPDGF